MKECKCHESNEIRGNNAVSYIDDFLDNIANGNWIGLYKCRYCSLLWKESYPRGQEHGGGDPLLEKISIEQARKEFDFCY